jgi:hypothetical protein
LVSIKHKTYTQFYLKKFFRQICQKFSKIYNYTNFKNKNIKMTKQLLDEQILNLIKKVEIPKNPFSFYLNISKIEKDLSSFLKDYFYKAINEFITPAEKEENIQNSKYGYSNFLLKIYYYSGFSKLIAENLQSFLDELKFYDTESYLKCAVYFDNTLKLKVYAFIYNKPEILKDINQLKRQKTLNKY